MSAEGKSRGNIDHYSQRRKVDAKRINFFILPHFHFVSYYFGAYFHSKMYKVQTQKMSTDQNLQKLKM